MNKVIKIGLICDHVDKDGNPFYYKEIYKILFDLQKQTREIKNKTIQYCWEYNNFSSDYYSAHNEYPNSNDVLGCSLLGFVYDRLKTKFDMYSKNYSLTIKNVCDTFNRFKKDFIRGDMSIINYKSDQPLDIHGYAITVDSTNNVFYIYLKLLNKDAVSKYGLIGTQIRFKALVRDISTKSALERCMSGEYHISASRLIYNKKKHYWFLHLSYSFDCTNQQTLDSEKILGVDLGVHYPICASVYGDLDRFIISGGEIEEFRRRIESRKLSMLKQGKFCGRGRIGHGQQKRNKSTYSIEDKIARARDTFNHKYSRALIDYAIKNQCGVIQMERLTGITSTANRFMKNWSYFDLQTKIEYKAKEVGIEIRYIDPRYTSQRCSRCGYIDRENRPTQSKFICKSCGFVENADYNASQNIGIVGIEMLIEKHMSDTCVV